MMNQAADCLELAADLLLHDGFAKETAGTVGVASEPRCTVGHLRVAACAIVGINQHGWTADARAYTLFGHARDAMMEYLFGHPAMGIDQARNLIAWNDADETTGEDVREVMLLAAKDLRNKTNWKADNDN